MSTVKESKMCDICHKITDNERDVHMFGQWMEHKGITVHYYCLLLSTNLEQNGSDYGGILGFLLRDIRAEIKLAEKRRCVYCTAYYASIACYKCKQYFHLECGLQNRCLFRFCDDFRTYCNLCLPLDDTQTKLVNAPPPFDTRCYICEELMGFYFPTLWIYGKCCGHGYVHRLCMQKYASSAGYYLKCIWCKNKDFREAIKRQGIFVPDRDAHWEQEEGAFSDLHRKHNHCDVEDCLCPRGRDYIGYKINSKWNLIVCTLCGSFGGHNRCIKGNIKCSEIVKEFKCKLCAKTEIRMQQQNATCSQESICAIVTEMDNATGRGAFQIKQSRSAQNQSHIRETPTFSDNSILNISVQNLQADETSEDVIAENLRTLVISSNDTDVEEPNAPTQSNVNSEYNKAEDIRSAETKTQTDITVGNSQIQNYESEYNKSNSDISTISADSSAYENEESDEIVSISDISSGGTVVLSISDISTDSLMEDEEIEMFNTAQSENNGDVNRLITQSPIIPSPADPSQCNENYSCYDMYEFDDKLNCLGTCTVRIDSNDPRLADKTFEEIKAEGLIEEKDIIARSSDIGIFAKINKIINERK